MSLTTKQREALQALADVMQEHDVKVDSSFDKNHYCSVNLWIGGALIFEEVLTVDFPIVEELLQEQE